MAINPAEEYHKNLPGFSGVSRKGMTAGKQLQGYDGPGKPGSASPKGRPDNASFDTSAYQSVMPSLLGIPSQPKNLLKPSNQSGSTKVGG